MNLDTLVCRGYEPWAPSRSASDLDVWHYDDIPTLGTFNHGLQSVLFLMLDEATARSTTWCYVPIDEKAVAGFNAVTFDTVEDMMASVYRCFRDREAVFVRANDYKIKQWGREHVTDSVYAAAVEYLRQVADALEAELKSLTNKPEPPPVGRTAPDSMSEARLMLAFRNSALVQYASTTSVDAEDYEKQIERVDALEEAGQRVR